MAVGAAVVGVAVGAAWVAVTVAVPVTAGVPPSLIMTYSSSPKKTPVRVDMRQFPRTAPVVFGAFMATERLTCAPGLTARTQHQSGSAHGIPAGKGELKTHVPGTGAGILDQPGLGKGLADDHGGVIRDGHIADAGQAIAGGGWYGCNYGSEGSGRRGGRSRGAGGRVGRHGEGGLRQPGGEELPPPQSGSSPHSGWESLERPPRHKRSASRHPQWQGLPE